MRKRRRQKAEVLGRVCEKLAAIYYRLLGYKLRESRFKTPLGEIDLIVERQNSLVFVEVKFRQKLEDGLVSLSRYQQQRIQRAARWYLMKFPEKTLYDLRFDFIVFARWRFWRLQNAF